MHRIFSIFKKELRGYFNSAIAFIVVTVLLIGVGYFFFQIFFINNQASLRPFFRFAGWSFLLFAPAIAMKAFAEERKSGTLEPLLTLPVRDHEVVLGKFFAAWMLLLVYLVITLAYPISIHGIGDLDWGPVIGGYLGLFLLGGTYLSLGVFASSVTQNQVVSLIVAFVICLGLFMLDLLLPFIPESLQSLFEFIGVDTHFRNIARGVIDSRDVIYYVSLMVFMLFAAVQVIEARMTDRSRSRLFNKAAYVLSAFGCLVCVNLFSTTVFGRIDLTADRMYTLSEASKDMMRSLDDQLLVTAYFSEDLPAPFNNHVSYLRDQLEDYRTYSGGKFQFEFKDPGKEEEGKEQEADRSLQAELQAAGIPKVDVQKFEKDQMVRVRVYMGVKLDYQDKSEVLPVLRDISNLEYELSSRMARLLRERTPVIGFLAGHGEPGLQAGLTEAKAVLEKNYELSEVDLSKEGTTLDEIDVLVVAGPATEVPPWQRFTIDQFLMGGGKAAFLIDRFSIELSSFMGRPLDTGLAEMLTQYGVTVRPDLVLDAFNQRINLTQQQGGMRFTSIVSYPPLVRVRDLDPESPVTKNMSDLTIPFISGLEVEAPEGVKASVIARSSPNSWLFEPEDSFLVDPQALPRAEQDDFVGPQDLVAMLEGSFSSYFADKEIPPREEGGEPVASALVDKSPETRMAVIGSSRLIQDGMRNRLAHVFFANIMDWMVQDERLIAMRARSIANRPLEELGEKSKNAIKYGNMFGLPLAFILFGVVRMRVRTARKRRGIY